MWEKLNLPKFIAERFIGVTLPINDSILLVSYQGIHTLNLSKPYALLNDINYPEGRGLFNSKNNTLTYKGFVYKTLGLHGGEPTVKSPKGEHLVVDLNREVIEICDHTGRLIFDYQYEDLSGDWCVSTFSQDGQYVLLLLPFDICVFKRGI